MTDQLRLAIKIDVDTDRGTREGVVPLARVLDRHGVRGTFLFSLGPDNTGRAIKRVFRPGFFAKVSRTNVVKHYGLRTLMNGVLLPAPDIGRRNADTMRAIANSGHEVGIHCWDHIRWQDGLAKMGISAVRSEFTKAREAFERIFGRPARTAGAAGWQADANSLEVYDEASLDYASDARGTSPFRPRIGTRVFRTIQMPTTLPTLDELIGRPEYPEAALVDTYLDRLVADRLNAFTGHAEFEGMHYVEWLDRFLSAARASGVRMTNLAAEASALSNDRVPVADLVEGQIDGRSGTMAVQDV